MREAKTIKNPEHFYSDTTSFIDSVISYLVNCPEEAPPEEFWRERQRTISKDLRLHLGLKKSDVCYDDDLGY